MNSKLELREDADSLLLRLAAAGVRIEHREDLPTAAVGLDCGGYTVYLGAVWSTATESQRATLLAHELAHIVRGDLLRDVDDHEAANLAQDCVINDQLHRADIISLGGILVDHLRARVGDDISAAYGWRPIYDRLCGAGAPERGHDVHYRPAASEAAEARAAAGNTAARILLDDGELGRLARSLGASVQAAPRPIAAPPAQEVLAALGRALRHAVRAQGRLVRVRSYARPGRVAGLRGVTRQKRGRVLIAVDVSGSMVGVLPAMLGMAAAIARETDARIVGWDTALHIGAPAEWQAGGGTDAGVAIAEAVRYRPDVAVIVTDGMVGDVRVTKDCPPIIWALPDSASAADIAPVLRARDVLVRVGEIA